MQKGRWEKFRIHRRVEVTRRPGWDRGKKPSECGIVGMREENFQEETCSY
jgi:hypothetical protein